MYDLLHKINLWLKYNDTYMEIRKNKQLYAHMQDDPGVKSMGRGWVIVWLIFAALAVYGRM